MKSKAGDQFDLSIADGYVLMEVTGLRCGDVWDCNPVEYVPFGRHYAQEYGSHMVFTDEQVAQMVARHKRRAS